MAAITIVNNDGSTQQVACAGTVGSIYVISDPKINVTKNYTPQAPGTYCGLYVLQYSIGTDGLPWYRYETDIRVDDSDPRFHRPLAYTATYAP